MKSPSQIFGNKTLFGLCLFLKGSMEFRIWSIYKFSSKQRNDSTSTTGVSSSNLQDSGAFEVLFTNFETNLSFINVPYVEKTVYLND